MITADTRQAVCLRANDHCEYCRLPQAASLLTFHVDHIVGRTRITTYRPGRGLQRHFRTGREFQDASELISSVIANRPEDA